MEAGIEARHLRKTWKPRSQRLDSLDLDRKVQRRKGNQRSQLFGELRREAFRSEVIRAAMDQAMADGVGARKPQAGDLVEERA